MASKDSNRKGSYLSLHIHVDRPQDGVRFDLDFDGDEDAMGLVWGKLLESPFGQMIVAKLPPNGVAEDGDEDEEAPDDDSELDIGKALAGIKI